MTTLKLQYFDFESFTYDNQKPTEKELLVNIFEKNKSGENIN